MKFDSFNIEHLSEICRSNNVKLVYLFGSFITGKVHSQSDLDLAVVFSPKIEIQKQTIQESRLATQLFSIMNGIEVDIVNLQTLKSPLLRYRIVFSGSLIVNDDVRLKQQLERKIMYEYEDTKHLRWHQLQSIIERIRTERFATVKFKSNYLEKYVTN